MKKFKEKGFTLIELIAVLVIMAILALIVTPLVMSIIRKARISADKRSIDAYGRSIELAIAGYLLDTGKFPTSIDQLTIEYSGNKVECETTQINTDSSVYLAGCKVDGRSVEGYTYGTDKNTTPSTSYKAYKVGDEVTYNNANYYVIKNSSASEDSVTLLKAEPLTAEEIATYSAGTGADTGSNGVIAYGVTSNYSISYVKQTIDAWKTARAPFATEARLISLDELKDELGYEFIDNGSVQLWSLTENTPNWVWTGAFAYWTMITYNDSTSQVLIVSNNGALANIEVGNNGHYYVIRPVIVLPKSAL